VAPVESSGAVISSLRDRPREEMEAYIGDCGPSCCDFAPGQLAEVVEVRLTSTLPVRTVTGLQWWVFKSMRGWE
jgi:hypothetical protein